LWSVGQTAGHDAVRFALSPTRPGGATVRQGCGTVPVIQLHDREKLSGRLCGKTSSLPMTSVLYGLNKPDASNRVTNRQGISTQQKGYRPVTPYHLRTREIELSLYSHVSIAIASRPTVVCSCYRRTPVWMRRMRAAMVLRYAIPDRDRLASSHRWRCSSGPCRPRSSRGRGTASKPRRNFCSSRRPSLARL
jgi:hypothetical protein